ncbi:MAG: hypothetical protein JXB50_08640 [Spirochaetes bacterium]|nr:hypothetical protein [Spirochaetota bacterium]
MKKLTIMLTLLTIFFSCSVNEYTALIRVENSSSTDITNLKIGGTLITGYLKKGAVYDYWSLTQFSGIVAVSGVDSAYDFDVELTIKPMWLYSIYIYSDTENNDVWSVSVDKVGTGDEDETEVKNFM